MSNEVEVRRALKALGLATRSKTQDFASGWRAGVSHPDFADALPHGVSIGAEANALFDTAVASLQGAPTLEYLNDSSADDVCWRFVCEVAVRWRASLPAEYISLYAKPVESLLCHFPIEHLEVTESFSVGRVRFEPPSSTKPPEDLSEVELGVAVVSCSGTSRQKMRDRAAADADHALTFVRAELDRIRGAGERQLRFRRGETYWFDSGAAGWHIHDASAWPISVGQPTIDGLAGDLPAGLPIDAKTKLDRCIHRALTWYERGLFEPDPTIRALFLFFGLEAALGRSSDRLKSYALAYRRAVLDATMRGHIAHPSRLHDRYTNVRSMAVHGEEPAHISASDVQSLSSDLIATLRQAVQFADENSISSRSRLISAVESRPEAAKVREFLLSTDFVTWSGFFGSREEAK